MEDNRYNISNLENNGKEKLLIITHSSCMDGLAAAALVVASYKEEYECAVYYAQYGEHNMEKLKEYILRNIYDFDKCIITDFTPNLEILVDIYEFTTLTLYDHHETARKILAECAGEFTYVFDINRSGARIVFDELQWKIPENDITTYELVTRYVQDRDIWTWKEDRSKEFSAGLNYMVEQNDVSSFLELIETFNKPSITDDFGEDILTAGTILTNSLNDRVAKKMRKVFQLQVNDIDFHAVNSCDDISELGNAICLEKNTPALIFFITEHGECVCSVRSTNEMDDVGKIAESFGGGGHRNAAGFQVDVSAIKDLVVDRALKLQE